MRYLMKQKIFSLADRYAIRNEADQVLYYVEGQLFTIGHKLSFQDASGNELLFLRQKVFSAGARYEIFRGEEHVASIHKELFTFFHCTFDIHVDAQGDLVAEGNLSDHEYTISRAGAPVAQISKQWFTLADTYGVETDDREDQVLLLATTVVIDLCCHENRRG
jgi:uncharacterized protein YxjI